MGRSAHRRATTSGAGGRARRAVIAAATLAAFGVLIAVSQISSAGTDRDRPEQINGLDVLGNSCENSDLPDHTGFQEGGQCVSTAFGEVGDADQNPTLLITEAPESVGVGEPFQLRVSTRNLVRDRFLPAAQGGYYVESALLTPEGLTRGHFHTACRMLTSTTEALDPEPVPAFFVATEDGGGGAEPDIVTIQVSGLPQEGIAQCASWAGDGSHRIPMMQRANQTPAIDAVRIQVGGAGDGQPEEQPGEEPGPGEGEDDDTPGEEAPGQEDPQESPAPQDPQEGEDPAEQDPDEEQPEESPSEEPAPESPEASPTAPEDDGTPEAPAEQDEDDQAPTPAPIVTEPTESAQPSPSADPIPTETETPDTGGLNAPATDNLADTDDSADADAPLALTGANTMSVLFVGLALIAGGVLVVHLTQRRRYSGPRR
ncbi:hypothetical protein ACN27F_19030 [Solwaraspora sp. WMMB335]|uniref:hypothetical protein n=1 Tax=Solwaraspora sp. WMMB335 TaxID=3404118 RepID=UPI003B942F28